MKMIDKMGAISNYSSPVILAWIPADTGRAGGVLFTLCTASSLHFLLYLLCKHYAWFLLIHFINHMYTQVERLLWICNLLRVWVSNSRDTSDLLIRHTQRFWECKKLPCY